jgi:hypothetical protein
MVAKVSQLKEYRKHNHLEIGDTQTTRHSTRS